MIIVTGTKRSGTSMWMQVLVAAGLPYIGDKFPRDWGEVFRDANPEGYYESELMAGIYWETNPHPRTGAYLFPEATREHAVKVFVPGLVRTDVAFIDRCIATVRPWREYVASVTRLRELMKTRTDGWAGLPPVLEWWVENYSLIRDIATRGYPAHVVAYEAVLADPERHVREVLGWIGVGDVGRAISSVAAVDRPDRPASDPVLPNGISREHVEVFDALHERIAGERPLDDDLLVAMNRTHEALQPLFLEQERAIHERLLWRTTSE